MHTGTQDLRVEVGGEQLGIHVDLHQVELVDAADGARVDLLREETREAVDSQQIREDYGTQEIGRDLLPEKLRTELHFEKTVDDQRSEGNDEHSVYV